MHFLTKSANGKCIQYLFIPDDKVIGVDFRSTAAVEQNPRVADDGALGVVLVPHGRHAG